MTDINNDGQIDGADSGLAQKAFEQGATEEDIEKGTEYLFVNDDLSNGLWDKDDPEAPASEKEDDDAQEIKITEPGIDEGEVWLEHPAIDALTFYDSRECTTEVPLKPGNRFPLGQRDWPDSIFVRADGNAGSLTNENPEMTGEIRLKIKIGSKVVDGPKIKMTIVKAPGGESYFEAVRDYIYENNSSVFSLNYRNTGSSRENFRIVHMVESLTTVLPLEIVSSFPNYYKIADVVALHPDASVIINGNFNYQSWGTVGIVSWALGKTYDFEKPFDKCWGNVFEGGVKKGISTLHPSPSDHGFFRQGASAPLNLEFGKGNLLAAENGMGGMKFEYAKSVTTTMIGRSSEKNRERIVFTVTTLNSESVADLVNNLIASRIDLLPGGNPGEYEFFSLDGGSSIALAAIDGSGNLAVVKKAGRHHPGNLNTINNYIRFYSTKPR